MSTLAVAAIIIGFTIGIFMLLVKVYNNQKQKIMSHLFNRFSQKGTENNLSFSSQEMLEHCAFGIDGLKRKILIMTKVQDQYNTKVISLDEVRACSVKKTFDSIDAGNLKNRKLEQHLRKMVLHFEFINNKLPMEILFFDNTEHNIYQLSQMEQKAKHWQAMLSKLIYSEKKIA